MPTKAELLSKLKKPQLLEVAKKKRVNVKPSWSKGEIVDALASRLTKAEVQRIIARYVKVEAEREVVEEIKVRRRVVREKVKAEAAEVRATRARIRKSKLELIRDIERAMDLYEFPDEELVYEYKRRVGRLPEVSTPRQLLFEAPTSFLEYMWSMFYTTRTGKGLEYRFLKWLKESDKLVGYIAEKKPKSIKMRAKLRGASGVEHEIDIYIGAELGLRDLSKVGISMISLERGRIVFRAGKPVRYFIECKSQRQRVDVNVINDFRGKVEDICEEMGVEPDRLIIVSSSGFTENAAKVASKFRVAGQVIELIKETTAGHFVREFPATKK